MTESNTLIDITMTATRRPELVFKTLHSFYEKCFRPIADRCRIIVNVDPVGHDIPSVEVLNIVSSFFRSYYIHMPLEASFPRAFIWTWTKVEAPWVFHLEEDWELLQDIDIMDMITVLRRFPQLALLRLPYNPSGPQSQKNWSHFYPWNGHYYECPYDRRVELGFCGHPSLIRGSFVRGAVPYIYPDLNPEKQFHHGNEDLITHVAKHIYGNWGKPGDGPYVKDIGRKWMVEHGFAKKGNKAVFTQWEKITT